MSAICQAWVLTRLLHKARDEFGIQIIFTNHKRRAKRRMIGIQYAKGDKQRNPLYTDFRASFNRHNNIRNFV